ncbi:MAG: Rne/Rng family ribonuclease [Bacillati bacterium ANGP1]|uniref:Rne/Rng family ribonuclease n=1 Tax=Candidatus Segetimicrobium genomatis TaxID=2569760 RepID=A0A537J8W1_9BACT|nr:MAG: Rne/Rng family ribonuclease [Terrabacteria group bacterium ANGP1]
MRKEILASVDPAEVRVAILEDGVLSGIMVERGEPLAGNIYKGRVASVLPGMEAAFVDIGLERNAFLPLADIRSERIGGEELEDAIGRGPIAERLRVGQEILVQVTKEPRGSKGARATTYVALPGHYIVLMPTVTGVGVSRRIEHEHERKRLRGLAERVRPVQARGGERMGLIVRTAAEGIEEQDLADDARFLARLWEGVTERARATRAPALLYQDLGLVGRVVRDLFTGSVDRFVVDSPAEFERIRSLLGSFPPELLERVTLHTAARPLFEAHDVEREIERALHRKVWLRSGGYLVFDRTEAATVIDVNTGKYVGKTDQPSTILRTNLEAAAEVARQIRLRDIGGIILIDFIDMESEKHRRRVVVALEEAVQADRTKIHIIDLTGLGLVELTRKRVYQSLDEIMRIPCPYCEGRGRVLSPQSMAVRVRRELARAARASRAPCLVAEVHPEVAAILAGDARWTDTISRESGKTIFVRSRPGAHLERMDLLAGDSVEAAAIAVASAGNGRGAVDGWLDPARGEVLDVPDGGDGDPWPAGDPGGKRGILGRLRSWWGGRVAARRMGALERERTHVTHAGGR